jgi:aspartyl-tRNA(Asn)/glutamyl-tRNA(Gln) amidotransferase subunit B
MTAPYTIIIGLEVHVQLLTESKLFCGCGTRFGAPPNTQTCPVCLGLPGALPVVNRKAFELALRTAAALNCQIARFTKWDRKNYFYPDLPKGYQISQYDLPIGQAGWLMIGEEQAEGSGRRIGILRAHLEEDAGKSMHDEKAGKADSRIDLNRAGTPLLEIVTQPDLRSPAEAKRFLTELKLLLSYLDVSDCNMQEGSLRVDANVNLHVETPAGRVATPIVEVKNMNSFRAVERALDYEVGRQWSEWQASGRRLGESPKSTRGWDEASQTTRLQRAKEESSDYRYFPDPDLPPVRVSEEEIERVRASLGELPAALRARLEETYGISPYQSDVLVHQGRRLVDYFIALADACGDAKAAANWVQQDVLRWMGENQLDIARYPIAPPALAGLIGKVHSGAFSVGRGREVLAEMVATGKPLAEAVRAVGIEEVDDAAVAELCRELVRENPKIAAEVRQGILKGLGALIGQAKKQNPNVDPNRVRAVCRQLIDGGEA